MYDLFMTIVVQQDGSVLIGGWTGGSWSGVNAGTDSYDWAVISLSADGEEEWRWQVNLCVYLSGSQWFNIAEVLRSSSRDADFRTVEDN